MTITEKQKRNWANYQALVKIHGSTPKAVRSYLAALWTEQLNANNQTAMGGIQTTEQTEDLIKRINGLNRHAWLTDDDLWLFAASLGFNCTIIRDDQGAITKQAENYAEYCTKGQPEVVALNTGGIHWRTVDKDNPGGGDCGAYVCTEFANRLKRQFKNSKVDIEYKKSYEQEQEQAQLLINEHSESVKRILTEMPERELLKTYGQAVDHAIDKSWLKGEKATTAVMELNRDLDAILVTPNEAKSSLIDVLTQEAKNTFDDKENNYFKSLESHKKIEKQEKIEIEAKVRQFAALEHTAEQHRANVTHELNKLSFTQLNMIHAEALAASAEGNNNYWLTGKGADDNGEPTGYQLVNEHISAYEFTKAPQFLEEAKQALIHVLATEAQNTFHDDANNYFSDGLYIKAYQRHTENPLLQSKDLHGDGLKRWPSARL